MSNHQITLIGRGGCHLCDDARAVVFAVLDELSDVPGSRTIIEVSIDDDDDLRAAYWDQIPVVLIDGQVHNFWNIDAQRLKSALVG